MNKERYEALMTSEHMKLSDNEIKEGWHFCSDWDGLLIHPSHPEAEHCTCHKE